jgi:hypothetical protein
MSIHAAALSYFDGIQPASADVAPFVMPAPTCPPLPGARILFVDGDNTIRRRPDGDFPEGHEALDAALRSEELKDVLIVASGQWKDVLSMDTIRGLFSEEVAVRIVDKTPNLGSASYPYHGADGKHFYKPHLEIHAWLAVHPEIAAYCAVEPSWLIEPHVECALFIQDGDVFGAHPHHVEYLRQLLGPGTGAPPLQP